ncbi:MAG: restriction endonuclease [Planctomycetota bacterium]
MSILPADISNLLAVAIRDVIWFKTNVLRFFQQCGVPLSIMIQVKQKEVEPTIKLVHFVLDELSAKGDEGWTVAKKMLTEMYYWKDVHSIQSDRRDKAIASLKELQKAYQKYQSQEDFKKQQAKQEVAADEERRTRGTKKPLDHAKLRRFREEFDRIHSLSNAIQRGNEFEKLMNEIFDYYCEESRGSFRRTGEQIDGLFKLDNHWHYVEIRWRQEKTNAADVSVLRDRAKDAYGGDTKALFISMNGFSPECLESIAGKSDERVILMDGFDLRCVLDCQIAFDVLLTEKQVEVIRNKKIFVSASEIIRRMRTY